MYDKEITIDLMRDLFEKQRKYVKEKFPGSDTPSMMFNCQSIYEGDVYFQPSNWNSGQDLIRYYLTELLDLFGWLDSWVITDVITIDDENKWTVKIIAYNYEGNHTFVILPKSENSDSGEFDGMYVVGWYKNRGCTETFLDGHEFITLRKYIELCNVLRFSKYFSSTLWNYDEISQKYKD